MEYGLKYFLRLMKDYNGDVTLALAAYNAGSQRIKEYRESTLWRDDPFQESNPGILQEYLKKLKGRNNP